MGMAGQHQADGSGTLGKGIGAVTEEDRCACKVPHPRQRKRKVVVIGEIVVEPSDHERPDARRIIAEELDPRRGERDPRAIRIEPVIVISKHREGAEPWP